MFGKLDSITKKLKICGSLYIQKFFKIYISSINIPNLLFSLCLVLLTNLINRLVFVYKVLKTIIDISEIDSKSSFRKTAITNL